MTEQPKLEELRKIAEWAKAHGCIDQSLEKIIPFVETLEIQQSEEYQLGNAAANALFEMFPTRAFNLYQDDMVKLGTRIKQRTQGQFWESIHDVPKNIIVVYDREGDEWKFNSSERVWEFKGEDGVFRYIANPNNFKPFTDQKNAPA